MTGHVFISHSTRDDDVVARIRTALEGFGVPTWVDSRRLTACLGRCAEHSVQAISRMGRVCGGGSSRPLVSKWRMTSSTTS